MVGNINKNNNNVIDNNHKREKKRQEKTCETSLVRKQHFSDYSSSLTKLIQWTLNCNFCIFSWIVFTYR